MTKMARGPGFMVPLDAAIRHLDVLIRDDHAIRQVIAIVFLNSPRRELHIDVQLKLCRAATQKGGGHVMGCTRSNGCPPHQPLNPQGVELDPT